MRRHRLTLVSAPAGSGKTVLCATLAQGAFPAAWVTLDETDDDFPVFVSLLVTALRSHLQESGRAVLNFLQTVPGAQEKPAQLAGILINSLDPAGASPHILILDDYHTIADPAIHQFVAYLLDYLPDSLRLVISTRLDPPLPLPRLRARGQVAEVRLTDLRFDEAEAADFLNQRRHLGLSDAEVASLQRHTGGWVAALQLLAAVLSSIEGAGARSSYIGRLAEANRSIFDLLADEVLAHQPRELQDFLLKTSILPELTSENCRAVTGNPDASPLLAAAFQRNLFLSALTPDALNGPFRYHDLFGHFLQHRLRAVWPDQWPELHLRAAGMAASPERKLLHLTQAEMWEDAAQLLEEMAQVDTERRFTRRVVVNAIEALPDEVRRNHPWLLLCAGQYYAIRGQIEMAMPRLAQAAARFHEQGDALGEVEILVARAMFDALNSDEIISSFRRKVETVGHLMRPDQMAVYHAAELWHAIALQDWPSLTRHMQANITLASESGDPGALTMASLGIGPHMLFNDAGMAVVEAFAVGSLRMAGEDDWIAQICAQGLLGFIRFWQGKLDEAEEAIHASKSRLDEIGGLAWVDDHVDWLILALALARRAYRAFDDHLAAQSARRAAQETSFSYRKGFLYLRGRSLWLRNRTREAQDVLAQMQADVTPTGYEVEDEERLLLLASLVAMAKGDTGAAKRDLRKAITLHERVRHTVMLTHPRLTLATLYGQQNRWDDALDELRIVLSELKARGMPGVILQEGESIAPVLAHAVERGVEREMLAPLLHILQPSDTPQIIALPGSDDYLTARESEVLRLLATGATNPAIAAQLSITERTVKAHVTRILAKLGAATRTEAVARASQMGLV